MSSFRQFLRSDLNILRAENSRSTDTWVGGIARSSLAASCNTAGYSAMGSASFFSCRRFEKISSKASSISPFSTACLACRAVPEAEDHPELCLEEARLLVLQNVDFKY